MIASTELGWAWSEAESCLPLGWHIRALVQDGMTWDAIATVVEAFGPGGLYGPNDEHVVGHGDTPTDALRDLSRVLRGGPQWTP